MPSSLSADYLSRLAAPRGVGDLVPADAAGEVGSVVGGSGVRVTLRFAKDTREGRRVAAARFRPFGSAAPLAPGSVLVERLVGLSDAQALALRENDLLRGLGGPLPVPVSRAAAHLLEAVSKALSDPQSAAIAKVSAPGVLVCRCLGVGDRVVRRAIRGGALDVASIGLVTAAGHGCHSCWPDLRSLLDEETARERTARGDAVPAAGSDPLALAVRGVVEPLLRAQGIALGEASVAGDLVRLSIARTAPDALASEIGAVAMARHALREVLGETIRVELIGHHGAETEATPHVREARARYPG